ncbi:MAG: sulfite dehydrogenase [Gammaproteobacteria bacterium]|nr:sulfite dehydrogenase [Gammaproteobacteria bacterium]
MSERDGGAGGHDDRERVAGNGLLDRRLFLKAGGLSGALLLAGRAGAGDEPTLLELARPAWMRTPGRTFSNYGQPAAHERGVIRWISANAGIDSNGVSWCPLHDLEGTIVPNGLHFERHHNGVPAIDPARHRLLIHGLVARPLWFTMEDLARYPMVSRTCFVECGGNSNAGWRQRPIQTAAGYFHGLVSCSEWTGVPLALLLDEAGLTRDAQWLIAEGADAFAMDVSIPVEKAREDAILALYQNGERVRPENGYPLRLIVPGWEGVLNVKWLRRLEASAEPVMARNETSRYTELLPSGKARMFTFVMDAKSLITSPSAGMQMRGPGLYEVKGLAWSGHGRIRAVDVSADGGRTWAPAALQEPVLPACFTRFRIPWHWDGSAAVLKSRATDQTGNVQPERDALVAERGRHGYFHYNAIVAWQVGADGRIHHVYA